MSILQCVAKCTSREWHAPLELSPLPDKGTDQGLWVDPIAFIEQLNGWALAQWAMRTAQGLQFWALPKPRGPGAPQIYCDESVRLTSLVAAAWRIRDRQRRHSPHLNAGVTVASRTRSTVGCTHG